MECDVFQMENLVASSFGENQWDISRAHGGKPIPCTQPLSIHHKPSASTVELKPKHTFAIAERINPVAMNVRALVRSPRNPLANLERPYSSPCSVRNSPRSPLLMPRACPIPGMATLIFLRTK